MGVVDRSFDHSLKTEEKACAPLASGIMQYGYQCGMVWGGALAAGAQAYRLYGSGSRAETAAILASQLIVESFCNRNKYVDCSDITEVEWKPSSKRQAVTQILKFFIKGGPIGCFRMAAGYAPIAFDAISSSMSEMDFEVPEPPVSCAALLASKMGASDLHRVMVSGFAGGIGLNGSGCGALGAAIWFNGIRNLEKGNTKIDYKDPGALALIDRFLKITNYEFECKEIVGRGFESISNHADYLHNGGCADIIDMLAGELTD
jgi:hypothetical protein